MVYLKQTVFEYRRKIDLEYFLPLNKYFKIFIIQKNLYRKDEILLSKTADIILGKAPHWKNFDDTSAIVKNMDCIISIDTSLVHLAGSIIKEHFYYYQIQPTGGGHMKN